MRRCIATSVDGFPAPRLRRPRSSMSTMSDGRRSPFATPAGATRMRPGATRTDTLPSPPEIRPRSYNLRQAATICFRVAVSPPRGAGTIGSGLAPVDDTAVDQRVLGPAAQPLTGVRRVPALRPEAGRIDNPLRSWVEDRDVGD